MGDAGKDDIPPECFVCFRLFMDGKKDLPKCSGEIGHGYGTQHDMCGDCLNQLARKVVYEERENLRPDGIRCSVNDCHGTFTTDMLERCVDKDVYEEIRANTQLIAFEEAKTAGLQVVQCKKCTFFSVFDDPPETDPQFHCVQCNADHCRQCNSPWDDEHKQHNKCAEPVREERRRQERMKTEQQEAKRRALEQEKEKRRLKEEQEKEDERRRKQNESRPKSKGRQNESRAQSTGGSDYEDAQQEMAQQLPRNSSLQRQTQQSSTASSRNASASRRSRTPAQQEEPSADDTMHQYLREFAAENERVVRMEKQQQSHHENMQMLNTTLVQTQSTVEGLHKQYEFDLDALRVALSEVQSELKNERKHRESQSEIFNHLQTFAIRMTNQFDELKERYEMDHGQLVLQLQNAQLQAKEKNAEIDDLTRQLQTVKESQMKLANRVIDQQSIIQRQQKLMDEYSTSIAAVQQQQHVQPIRPPPPQTKNVIRAPSTENDVSDAHATVSTTVQQKPKRHSGLQLVPANTQASPFQPPPPPQTTTSTGESLEDIMAWKARMKEQYEQQLKKKKEEEERSNTSNPLASTTRSDIRPGNSDPTGDKHYTMNDMGTFQS